MTATLVDRRREQAFLADALDRTVRDGESNIVLLRGEAGIGKTRLLTHFADQAAERHADIGLLAGYGQAMMNSLASDAFQAVRDCLRALTLRAQRSGSRELLNRVADSFRLHAPDWVESVPVVGKLLAAGMLTGRSAIESGRPAYDMDSRLDQLVRLVEELLARGPLLLVLDDLHWADTATIDLIVTLALRVRGPLMLVLAYRPDDLQTPEATEDHPLSRAAYRLRRYSGQCAELDLERLSGPDTELLIRQNAGRSPVPARLLHRIVAQSDGNPLFAESLMHVGNGAAAGRPTANMPRQIKAILEERLSFLTPADQRLLESAALIGYSFEVDYLAGLARMDVDDVYERLDVLLNEHGLVRPADPRGEYDQYTIHHPLLAEVLRERGAANGPRWRRLHRKLLEILEGEAAWDDELRVRAVAIAVGAGDDAKARDLALVAGWRQFELGAVTKGRQLARVAIDHGADSPSAGPAHHLLAECLSAEGDHVGTVAACEEAERRSRPGADDRFAVGLLWARSLRMTNRWRECLERLARLEAESRAADVTEVLAEVRMLEAEVALCGPVQDPAECVRLCLLVYDMTSDPALQARALGHRGLAYLAGYDAQSADLWLNRAIEVARHKEHPYAEYEAVHWLSKKTIACLELDRSWELLKELARTSDVSGVASESPFHLRDSSRVLGLRGSFDRSATAFARYVDACIRHALDRAFTTLACQVHELEVLFGAEAADEMLRELLRAAEREIVDPDRCVLLQERTGLLTGRDDGWTPVGFAVQTLGARPDEAAAADAIFRFDVGDLAVLRSRPAP
ncbi:ATP-binding protein [Actinomadura xylanilytica]|uniref:ATP-binding protein n=1 Tax=Actinomadura xylanilytica TaxID=887459 RepID=UPI00255A88E6|nr:AAA family ATPase [Actinomadura xylanilytica]MDL4773322.1 AAA family ATPase [Actinomadura xylanilytica]